VHAFSYAWSLVTWQRWHSHHLICRNQKPHATRKPHDLLQNWSYGWFKFYIAWIGIFDFFGSDNLDSDPMTFICELDPCCREIHGMCKCELPTSRLTKVIIWKTYRQTYKLCVVTSSHMIKMAVCCSQKPHALHVGLMALSVIEPDGGEEGGEHGVLSSRQPAITPISQ